LSGRSICALAQLWDTAFHGQRRACGRFAKLDGAQMLNWFRKLMPREERFFDLFAQHAKTAVGAAEALQFVSAALYSLGHGGNDAQKTMGIIAVSLYSQRYRDFHLPLGRPFMPKCNSTRYALRRLADGPRDGIEDYASQPNAGLLRRNRWSSDIGWRNLARHPGFEPHTITAGAWRATLLLPGSHSPSLRSFQP
jgi:hypothetical protein